MPVTLWMNTDVTVTLLVIKGVGVTAKYDLRGVRQSQGHLRPDSGDAGFLLTVLKQGHLPGRTEMDVRSPVPRFFQPRPWT